MLSTCSHASDCCDAKLSQESQLPVTLYLKLWVLNQSLALCRVGLGTSEGCAVPEERVAFRSCIQDPCTWGRFRIHQRFQLWGRFCQPVCEWVCPQHVRVLLWGCDAA